MFIFNVWKRRGLTKGLQSNSINLEHEKRLNMLKTEICDAFWELWTLRKFYYFMLITEFFNDNHVQCSLQIEMVPVAFSCQEISSRNLPLSVKSQHWTPCKLRIKKNKNKLRVELTNKDFIKLLFKAQGSIEQSLLRYILE